MAGAGHQLPLERRGVDRQARALEPLRLAWLEEPVWPPEDRQGLARVRAATTTPIAAGENVRACMTSRACCGPGAVDICQPSVIKFGGIEAVAQAGRWRARIGVDYVPHCFYFGPGFLASLHLAAALAPTSPSSSSSATWRPAPTTTVRARSGRLAVPTGPGLGSSRTWP